MTDDDDTDPFLMDAIDTVVETGQASTSFIQRRFKVGYARAGRIIDQMEERGIISGYQGSKPREVLVSKEHWQELKMGTTPKTEPQRIEKQETVENIKEEVIESKEPKEEQKNEDAISKTIEAVKKISKMNSSEEEY